ncbi:MAG: hypothetical protein ACRBBR_03210 [Cellvibrionaceae bacterium]
MLDWSRFQNLPGADTENFEKLCRGVIRRNFGSLGPLRELKNQPGVEFHITLNEDHSRIGRKNETIGWQNKWFSYKANGELTSSAKQQILHSLDKTKEHVSQINHWFLWTHKILAKCDQDWFGELQQNYDFILHLWNQDDLDDLLSGPALDLRNSYFGELALTGEMLSDQHERSIAPIRNRWLHEVHQRMDAELQVRKVLGEKEAWDSFRNIANNLEEVSDEIKSSIDLHTYQLWQDELRVFHECCSDLIHSCKVFDKDICGDDIQDVMAMLDEASSSSRSDIHKTLMQLRSRNLPLSLTITNALAYIKDVKGLFKSAIELLSQQLIAIVADAGGGKTQLSVELTAPTPDRPAGIFILGRSLKKGMTLNDIANNFVFYQKQVNNFEALVSAINSVGERVDRRIPVVIDGLNESQDPREWKWLLESALPIIKKYPNVVMVCTLRTAEKSSKRHYGGAVRKQGNNGREGNAHQSLPESTYEILSQGYNEKLTYKAIKDYFKLYKIKADPINAPLRFFSHPLNLKIFCEVTNRKAQSEVRISHFPSSIYSLFREQMDHTANTIASFTNLSQKYQFEDVKKAIYFMGECGWQQNSRSISEDKFRNRLNHQLNDWDADIVNLLAQEGIVFRDEGQERYAYELTPVYDRLGGFIIAEYLLEKNAGKRLDGWVAESEVIEKLFGDMSNQHPLSQDILTALVVLIPKTLFQQQLWKALPEGYQSIALALTPLIDTGDICTQTLDSYRSLITDDGLSVKDIKQLLALRYAIEHPLNAEFLNEILLNLPVDERDLSWTEYIRSHNQEIVGVVNGHLKSIKSGTKFNPETIRLRMIFLSWHLTSTVIDLRDRVTELLYYLGLQEPKALFSLTIELLGVNDSYVSERLLASSYALSTVLINSCEHKEAVIDYARSLLQKMFAYGAPHATTHLLAREYASCTIKLVAFRHLDSIQDLDQNVFCHPFPEIPRRKWGCVDVNKEEYSRYNSPLRMDFENYTIGHLIKDRGNYDYSHRGYNTARGNILWRINDLGWSHEKFEKAEKLIESQQYRYSHASQSPVERYGKKYSWIAYYELAGQLSDESKLEYCDDERFATDIDPFFPEVVEKQEVHTNEFLLDESVATKEWILDAALPDLTGILEIHEDGSDWILLHGYISEQSKKLDRNFYCSIDTAFISNQFFDQLQEHMANKKNVVWPHRYSSSFVYSGELYCEVLNKFDEEAEIRVQLGSEIKTYEQPEVVFNNEVFIKGGFFKREVPIESNLSILPTFFNYYWENPSSSMESVNRQALPPRVVKELELKFNPSQFVYLDKDNEKAVLNVNSQGDTYSNYRDLIYLRTDLLDEVAKKLGMKLIKHVTGERRYARTESISGEGSYRQFEIISP